MKNKHFVILVIIFLLPVYAIMAQDEFVPCVIDVSNVDPSCGVTTNDCDGADIAHNYAKWPDPYECYICAPGVTLLKGSKCHTSGVQLVWDSLQHQCILNGQGYPMTASHTCASGFYASGVTVSNYTTLVSDWYQIAMTKGTPVYQPNAGADAYVVPLTLEDGQEIQAAMSMGHGVLDGKCGATFLVKVGSKYVLLLQTDVRSWSLELSPGANTWLDETNVGGTCIIPEVRKIDASFVINQFENTAFVSCNLKQQANFSIILRNSRLIINSLPEIGDNPAGVSIYNILGQKVYARNVLTNKNYFQINLKQIGIAKGNYILHVKTNTIFHKEFFQYFE